MKKIIEVQNSRPQLVRIMYELGDLCNYKCWYCFPGSNEGSVKWPDIDIVKVNLTKIVNHYFASGLTEMQLNFLGGEPTLYKHLGELVKYVSENSNYDRNKCQLRITVQTNASRTLRWWREYGHYFTSVGISVHHEEAEVKHIEEVAKILLEKKVIVIAKVLMDHTAWDKCKDLVDQLCATKTKFLVTAAPIHINGVTTYNEEQKKYLKTDCKRYPAPETIELHKEIFSKLPIHTILFDDGSTEVIDSHDELILRDLNHFFGWECNIGKNFLFITKNGDLTGTCRAKIYNKVIPFNINDKNFVETYNPVLGPVICNAVDCRCAGEAMVPKKLVNNKTKVIPIYAN